MEQAESAVVIQLRDGAGSKPLTSAAGAVIELRGDDNPPFEVGQELDPLYRTVPSLLKSSGPLSSSSGTIVQ